MSLLRNSLIAAALLTLAACHSAPGDALGDAPDADAAPEVKIGLMTSLPLYWPLGVDMTAIADGSAEVPWQRAALSGDYVIEPLDTLSPIPALSPDAPDTDPLKGLTRLAVIQPRGLSPADNVALDDWVRAGGHLLLVLDPMLTGEYDLPLGDPRRPVETALIPPVVARWGMKISMVFHETADAAYSTEIMPGGARVPLDWPGDIDLLPGAEKSCVQPAGAIAICQVGKGRVTLIADAALFEHAELAGEGGAALRSVVRAALQ